MKVITYKKLNDIQKEYSTDMMSPLVVPATVKGIYEGWDPFTERVEFYIPVYYQQHVMQVKSGKPKKKTINNIFRAQPTMTKIGPITTLLLRLIGSPEQVNAEIPIHRLKKMACRLVFAPVGKELKAIAIGHPEKDYFLYLDDFYNSQPGDIIPATVARITED